MGRLLDDVLKGSAGQHGVVFPEDRRDVEKTAEFTADTLDDDRGPSPLFLDIAGRRNEYTQRFQETVPRFNPGGGTLDVYFGNRSHFEPVIRRFILKTQRAA